MNQKLDLRPSSISIMENIAQIIIEQCVRPGPSDRILVVTDTVKRAFGEPIFEYCKRKGLVCELVLMAPTQADGQEPEPQVARLIPKADVVIAVTKWSLSYAQPMVQARQNGAKTVSMPAPEQAMLQRCIPVDYKEMSRRTRALALRLTEAREAHIASLQGTHLSLGIDGFRGNAFDGIARNGELINLPDGEANIGIGDAEGVLVIDGSMPPDQESKWGIIGKIKDPIRLIVKQNKVVHIDGKREASVLRTMLSEFDASVFQLAELGIGTNPRAILTGNVTEDEKILGTLHIALGDNTFYGGRNRAPLHLDGVIRFPTLTLDKKVILEKGVLKI